jgi:hypothetical protein
MLNTIVLGYVLCRGVCVLCVYMYISYGWRGASNLMTVSLTCFGGSCILHSLAILLSYIEVLFVSSY